MDDPQHRELLEKFHGDSFGWALCCCRRDRARAEEVLQIAYLKVLDGRARFDPGGSGAFRTWLFAVIRRTATDLRRREWLARLRLARYARTVTASPRTTPGNGSHRELEQDERREIFLQAMERLSTRQREVLHLVFYHGLTLAEAAGVMAIGLGSARSHYDRGKKTLGRRLERCGVIDAERKTDGSGPIPDLA